MSDLLSDIDVLCNEIDNKVNSVNSGGCAVFAALMGQCLEAYGKVSIAIGNNDYDDVSIDDARNRVSVNDIDEWNDTGVYFNHVVVEFTYEGRDYHIDSSGVHPADVSTYNGHFDIMAGRMSVEEITVLAFVAKGWNRAFDRKQIPKIKTLLDEGFAKMFNRGLMPTTR